MIEQILENNEKVVWKGKQDFKTTMFIALGISILLIVIGYIVYSSNMSSTTANCKINGKPGTLEQCRTVGLGFSYGLFIIGIFISFLSYLYYKVTEYAITDKRLIIKSGLIGADLRSIYYDQIRSIFVNVGLIGKIFGTGTIMIDTGRITQTKNGSRTVYDKFSNIINPYDIYKIAQENLSNNKESLHSGRADFEYNKPEYKTFIQETEKMKQEI